jgi:hypothetical protein
MERNAIDQNPALRALMKLQAGVSVTQTTCGLVSAVDLRFVTC